MLVTRTLTLVVLVTVAALCDLKSARIPNVLTVAGCGVGLALRVPAGAEGMADGFLGLLAAFAVGLPLFSLGALGGGDVKLLAAVGAFLGLAALPPALLVTVLVGGGLAIGAAVWDGRLRETFGLTANLLARLVRLPVDGPRRTLATPGALTIPYGVAIAIGGLYGWFGHAAF